MKFDTTDINGKVGQKLTIVLTNDGSLPKAAMAHNIVILKPGTDVAAFIASASASARAAAGYLPDDAQASQMIVHTKLLGPGEEDTISFTPAYGGRVRVRLHFPGSHGGGDAREDHRAMIPARAAALKRLDVIAWSRVRFTL